MGHRLYDTLLPQFAKVFELRSYELALTQGVYSIVYLLGAIPAALYARRFGYKAAITFGLGSLGVGALVMYPAAETHVFLYFLFAVTVMSCGWILLEVAANPLAAGFGTIESSVRRLNMAQTFYPLGALLGVYAGRWILSFDLALPAERIAHSIVHPYIVFGAVMLVLAFLIEEARFPRVATEQTRGPRGAAGELRTLLSRRLFVFGMVAQFFSVLAMAGTWSLSGRFVEAAFMGDVLVWSLAVVAAGRFVGSALMYRIEPDLLLAAFACGGLVLALIAAFSGGPLSAISMIASSFFLSITWPTVLGISIRGLGQLMKLGTALVCMGGAIGAIAYQMLNVVWTFPSVHLAMLLPAFCYVAILAFAVASHRARRPVEPVDAEIG
jgi:FHS family L-fucose permease-like MFS transporter